MVKKVLIGVVVLTIVIASALFLWARSILTGDAVRATVERQFTKAIGQPVRIGTLGVAIFPRVTMTLGDVTMGQPARITVKTLHVGTDFRALLSRRIEHAALRLNGAHIEL